MIYQMGNVLSTRIKGLNVEVTIPLKYLRNPRKYLDLSLINGKVGLDLLRTKDCVLIEANNNITSIDF